MAYVRVSIILATFAFNFFNIFFSRLFYVNITFRHLFIIIKCPAELICDCMILIRSVPSTGIGPFHGTCIGEVISKN